MFDADEGNKVQIELSTRSVLTLLPLVASTAFAVVVWLERAGIGVYGLSEDDHVMFLRNLYIASLGFIWLSVALVRVIHRPIIKIAAPLAMIITILWILGFFYNAPQPGV